MDLFSLKLALILLSCIECCVGKGVLPEKLDAVLGQSITLKILIEKKEGDDIIWNFSDGAEQINVATLRQSAVQVADPYTCRASIDVKTGYLTLTSLQSKDSGFYSVTILGNAGTKTGETELRVLAPAPTSTPTSAYPETTDQCADYFVPLVVCLVVIFLLLAGYLVLLYKWLDGKKSGTSKETSSPVSKCEDSTYQILNLASMDKDETYSTLRPWSAVN
ncbi:uncharacterized protein PAE49_020763 isoform 1-T1 [Odontesthes bonariensis]|uniref:uncharacterized protein LOC142367722 isoform X1 n=1 Tax=Odontesthes bonariensis TaxID=219752 RepID=UPI003F58F939